MPSTLPDIRMSYGVSMTEEYKVKTIKYGDNYSSRTSEGINAVRQKWKWVWNSVTETDAETLRAFFSARKGVESIQWTPHGETVERSFVTTGGFRKSFKRFNTFDCSINVVEVFDNV